MSHVATITIDHTKVPGDLTDYVGLIVPNGSAGYEALYDLCLEGGGDIRLFKSDDTTELAREIVTFSVSAETGEIHYKYSGTLSSSVDTPIHVYADGSSADYSVTATYGRNAVWSDYAAVIHFSEASGTSAVDSTGNGKTGTHNGSASAGNDGKINKAVNYSGSNGSDTTYGSIAAVGSGEFTVSQWVSLNAIVSNRVLTYNNEGGGYQNRFFIRNYQPSGAQVFNIYSYQDSSSASVYNTAVTPLVDTWYYVSATRSGTDLRLYVNDTVASTVGLSGNLGGSNNWQTGGLSNGNFSNTKMDEFRVSLNRLSTNWHTTEYNNQNSYSTFYSVAAVGSSTDYPITAAAGTFAFTGETIGTSWARTIAAAAATFTQTGVALIFARGKGFIATAATFGLSGKAATFAKAILLVTEVSTFALTGIASTATKTKLLTAAAATFVLTNVDASVSHVRTMTAAAATFALTGVAATAEKAISMVTVVGTFILSTSITSLLGKVWLRSRRNGGTWERKSRSVGEWTRGNKNNDA